MIDLSRFKVVYGERVLNALALENISYGDGKCPILEAKETMFKPKFISVMAINEDGNIVTFCDEAWRFQFLPIKEKA